jgi:hypothetical protein
MSFGLQLENHLVRVIKELISEGGNRKYGFRRGNGGGFKAQPWFCDGCQKQHPGNTPRNGTLDGRSLCDRQDAKEMRKAHLEKK